MIKSYENFRENGWRSYHNDPAFVDEQPPNAKVISYFIKNNGQEVVDIPEPKQVEYTYEVSSVWLEDNLSRVLSYTKKWNDYKIYQCVALSNYLEQIKNGGYKKGIISRQEYAMLSPNKRGKK